MAGRFAPSPTGDLHVGNLRTALAAWLLARQEGRGFLVRIEDLDRASAEHERCQLDDLAALGIDHDGDTVRQSDRFDHYHDALADLRRADMVYPCWCSRREIAAAASAPHGSTPDRDGAELMRPDGAYPGTCRELSVRQRGEREAGGRPAALRLRGGDAVVEVDDRVHGRRLGLVDDVVLRRNDGVPSYNLAVVVDDHAQGVTQVVRADDLLSSTPRHIHLQRVLGLDTPEYAHVPLVVGVDGRRLAKRHGAVTAADLAATGVGPDGLLGRLARTLGIDADGPVAGARELLDRFRLDAVPRDAVVWGPVDGETEPASDHPM
ncbi:MAG: tRNA glutamyl-Q(34) synthetase GluQRS [Ilumatobacteraceae bacterium]